MILPHGNIDTPVFMPVATKGTLKGLTSQQIKELNCQIILGNTFHLGSKPGVNILNQTNGLHGLMNFDNNILTDSGGFQMVSLLKLSHVTEDGVTFNHPDTNEEIVLTPEHSMEIQMSLKSDIIMQLDDTVSSLTTGERVSTAMKRSIRWLDRCIKVVNKSSNQNLFPIIQGGLDIDLRTECINEMLKRNLPGHAIGGLSGGEMKESFVQIVDHCTNLLPVNKPRYLMGVGYAPELVICSALGCDMYDCVYPSRTARFGTALINHVDNVQIGHYSNKNNLNPIDSSCACTTCKKYSRAYLHSLFITNNSVVLSLLTVHNIAYQKRLMESIKISIIEDRFVEFIHDFFNSYYNKEIPIWVKKFLETLTPFS